MYMQWWWLAPLSHVKDRLLLLLLDVVAGMEYLHGENILHGDLKAANVCTVALELKRVKLTCLHHNGDDV